MAKKCLDEIVSDNLAGAAMKMLDWTGLTYDRGDGGKTGHIDHNDRRAALRTINAVFAPGDDGPFIRDAYDAFFDGFERLEHFVRINLIIFEDVEMAFRYYVEKMAAAEDRRVFNSYLETYGFKLAQDFLKRFASWGAAQPPLP